MMQQHYPDVPASIKYPLEQVVTEFPWGYMTNTVAYMIALALMEGVTHIGIFGADYVGASEYLAQRGCCEYWLGVAEGRGVHLRFPPGCDLLNRPHLLYGYESHPNGKRHACYGVPKGGFTVPKPGADGKSVPTELTIIPEGGSQQKDIPKLRDLGVPPAVERRHSLKDLKLIAEKA